jgi:L-rhamnose-H+ transport protein
VATFCGIMSACFSFALAAAKAGGINAASKAAGTSDIWTGLPALPVLLLGGFTTNFIWCLYLNCKNKTGYQYLASEVRPEHAHHGGSGGGEQGSAEAAAAGRGAALDLKIPVLANYLLSAAAGTCWYFQFFFYTMGATQMGKYDFASWTLHMSSIIIFATMWGWIFHEWKGCSNKAHLLIAGGIATLVLATIVIGVGAYLGKAS